MHVSRNVRLRAINARKNWPTSNCNNYLSFSWSSLYTLYTGGHFEPAPSPMKKCYLLYYILSENFVVCSKYISCENVDPSFDCMVSLNAMVAFLYHCCRLLEHSLHSLSDMDWLGFSTMKYNSRATYMPWPFSCQSINTCIDCPQEFVSYCVAQMMFK